MSLPKGDFRIKYPTKIDIPLYETINQTNKQTNKGIYKSNRHLWDNEVFNNLKWVIKYIPVPYLTTWVVDKLTSAKNWEVVDLRKTKTPKKKIMNNQTPSKVL